MSNLDTIIERAEVLGIIGYSEFTSAFPFSLIFIELTLNLLLLRVFVAASHKLVALLKSCVS